MQLKAIVGEAIADGYLFADYESVHPKQGKRYLTSEELQWIMTAPLHKPHLYLIRDMFLFPCYTSIPYSDMKFPLKEHLSLVDDGTWWMEK
ncbi:Uncharacterised protein [Bacteroides faecis]|uniref:Uncharacterized protein n=1 Tax=Bacteroides faecis TaxID=674529 RepID=A0A6N2VBQ6_9BACE